MRGSGVVTISVLVCNEQPLVRVGLSSVLGGEVDLEVVGQFGDGPSAAMGVAELRPVVLVADPQSLSSAAGKANAGGGKGILVAGGDQ